MAGNRAAIRYAKAVMSLASDKKTTKAVNTDMQHIAETFSQNEQLSNLLKNSVVKIETKKDVLLKVFPKLNPISLNLLDVLIKNKRIELFDEVALKYTLLFDELSGIETVTVTTAVPMTKDLEKMVLAKVKTLTSKTVELQNIVDQSILGGFILRVGDIQYNASVINNLNTLRTKFTLN
jgi:F-type H+-transporting ATPase subunit delta